MIECCEMRVLTFNFQHSTFNLIKDMEFRINTIEEALEDFREGKFLIVVDDEDRENEGDFIIAAEKITPEAVNFMLKNGRGVLCTPLPISRCKELELERQARASYVDELEEEVHEVEEVETVEE